MVENCPVLLRRYCRECKVRGHWTNDNKWCPKQAQRNFYHNATGALGGGVPATGAPSRGPAFPSRSTTGVSARGASVRSTVGVPARDASVRSTTGVSDRGASVRGTSSGAGSSHVAGKKRETPTIPTVPNKRHKAGNTPQGSKGPKEDLERYQKYKSVDDRVLPVLSLGNTAEKFPNVKRILDHLLEILENETNIFLKDYALWLKACENPQRLSQWLFDCVDKGVLQLQEKFVDVEALERLEEKQEQDRQRFQGSGGYLNFLTDRMDGHYCRFYVGQSSDLAGRIKVHKRHFDNQDDESLHYYLGSLGKDNRQCNFIRLFRLPPPDPEKDPVSSSKHRSLALNVLEMVMALAFRSLTTQDCEKYSPEGVAPARKKSIHLNVLIPLFQSSPVGDVQRFQARQRLCTSDDPDIRGWPAYQDKAKANAVRVRPRIFASLQDCKGAFNKSAREANPQLVRAAKQGLTINRCRSRHPGMSMEAVLGMSSFKEQEGLSEALPFGTPFGTLDSGFAIIIAQFPDYVASEDASQNKDGHLPFRLDKAGLTSEDSVVWPLDFGATKQQRSNDVPDLPLLYARGSKLSWKLLDASAAEGYIMTGRKGELR